MNTPSNYVLNLPQLKTEPPFSPMNALRKEIIAEKAANEFLETLYPNVIQRKLGLVNFIQSAIEETYDKGYSADAF